MFADYTINIKTANLAAGDGTDDSVSIDLNGSKGSATGINLHDSSRNDFQVNQ